MSDERVISMGSVRRWTVLLLLLAPLCPGHAGAPEAPRLLEEAAEPPYNVSTRVALGGAGEARLLFAYAGPDRCDTVLITPRELSLQRVRAGKTRLLAPPRPMPAAMPAGTLPLLVQRRRDEIAVVCGDTVLFRVSDLDPGEGRVGVSSSVGATIEEPRLQPVEPPYFSDDFMRGKDEVAGWEGVSGKWSATVVGDPARSANGFSFHAAGERAMAVAGFPFWDNYAFQASVRCLSKHGSIGIALYTQDADNYLALSWSSAEGLCLLRRLRGRESILARRAVAWVPGQWYRLAIEACGDLLTATVDGSLALEARSEAFGQGRIALLAQGADAFFDDVLVRPALHLRAPLPTAEPERWAEVDGIRIAGSREWEDYTLRANLRPEGKAAIGIAFGWQSPKRYHLFRWTPGKAEILAVSEDGSGRTNHRGLGGTQRGSELVRRLTSSRAVWPPQTPPILGGLGGPNPARSSEPLNWVPP